MTVLPQELQQHWTAVSPLLSIRNEHEYDLAVDRLNHLLDEVGTMSSICSIRYWTRWARSSMLMKRSTIPSPNAVEQTCCVF